MLKKIYKITKKDEPLKIYIGSTQQSLKKRLNNHFNKKTFYESKNIPKKFYEWLNNDCIIELITEVNGESLSDFETIEFNYIEIYRNENYHCFNIKDGRSKIANYDKIMNDKHHKKNRENGKQKEYSIKHHKKNKESGKQKEYNNSRHPDYIKWQNKISKNARKEGLRFKEYIEKYNIPSYNGPKRKENTNGGDTE